MSVACHIYTTTVRNVVLSEIVCKARERVRLIAVESFDRRNRANIDKERLHDRINYPRIAH